jgi:hypothetical protein
MSALAQGGRHWHLPDTEATEVLAAVDEVPIA